MSDLEPFLLYVSKRFLYTASRAFNLGLIPRRPLPEILKRIGVDFRELDREEARAIHEGIAEVEGLTASPRQIMRSLALSLLLPTGPFYASLRRVLYRAGIEAEGFAILELLAEIPRAMRPPLSYDLWLVAPRSPKGAGDARRLLKAIVEMVEAPTDR